MMRSEFMRAQPLMRVGRQRRLVRLDALPPEPRHEAHGGAEPDRLDDRRRAGLEAMRRVAVGDALAQRTSRIISPPP